MGTVKTATGPKLKGKSLLNHGHIMDPINQGPPFLSPGEANNRALTNAGGGELCQRDGGSLCLPRFVTYRRVLQFVGEIWRGNVSPQDFDPNCLPLLCAETCGSYLLLCLHQSTVIYPFKSWTVEQSKTLDTLRTISSWGLRVTFDVHKVKGNSSLKLYQSLITLDCDFLYLLQAEGTMVCAGVGHSAAQPC